MCENVLWYIFLVLQSFDPLLNTVSAYCSKNVLTLGVLMPLPGKQILSKKKHKHELIDI